MKMGKGTTSESIGDTEWRLLKTEIDKWTCEARFGNSLCEFHVCCHDSLIVTVTAER